jgi:hypothetical protein
MNFRERKLPTCKFAKANELPFCFRALNLMVVFALTRSCRLATCALGVRRIFLYEILL